jgi:hypothetical protein
VVTKALAKEPDARYQSCKELMQDLLNYRALGGPAGSPGDFGATVVVVGRPGPSIPPPPPPEPAPSKTGTLSGMPSLMEPSAVPKAAPPEPPAAKEEAAVTVVAPRLMPGASSLPSLTATSYGAAAPPAEPQSRALLVVVLIALLAFGGYLIWPTLHDVYFRSQPSPVAKPGGEPAPPPEKTAEPQPSKSADEKGAEVTGKESKPVPAAETKAIAPPAKKEPPASVKAEPADLALRIERQLAKAGLATHVKVEVRDNVVRFTGSPNPRERRKLQQMGKQWAVPAGISVEYAFDTLAESSPEVQPKTAPGMGEIEVLTDISGASAVLIGPDGKSDQCRTPCRFEDLVPGRYALEVTKDGLRTEKRILQLARGAIKPVNISMQAGTARLEIVSRPPGADILINGQRQGRQTPATVSVAPGNYRIGVQKPGFALYEESLKINADELKKLNVSLAEQRKGNGWVDIRSVPPGADILIDGTNTGQKTPAKIELPSGQYTLMLYLAPRPAVRETITVQPGQTVQVYRNLSQ